MRDSDLEKARKTLARVDNGDFDKQLGRDPHLQSVVSQVKNGWTISLADVKLLNEHGMHDLVVLAHSQGKVALEDDLVGNLVRDAFPASTEHGDPHTIIQKAIGDQPLTMTEVAQLTRLGRTDLLERAFAAGRITVPTAKENN